LQGYLKINLSEVGKATWCSEITEQGWSDAALKTLGSLTREWATIFTIADQTEALWELPMIELHGKAER